MTDRPWSRRWFVVVPAALVAVLGIAACGGGEGAGTASRSAPAPTSTIAASSTATTAPTPSTVAPTTIPDVEVPKLIGMKVARAKNALSDLGLEGKIRYRSTARYAAGTVISQSRKTGAGVLPDAAITLVIAKAPPPPPTTAPPPPPPTSPPSNCDPSYPGVCLDPGAEDYDCAGGSGNGPKYVQGPVQVRQPDPFDLDSDGDGIGCGD